MRSALEEFAGAVDGHNSVMEWSSSPEILRRQMVPIFRMLARHELSVDEALDAAVNYVAVSVNNNVQELDRLFSRLKTKLTEFMRGIELTSMIRLEEFFMGLDNGTVWSRDISVLRRESLQVFAQVEAGTISPSRGLLIFVANVTAKRDHLLCRVNDMFREMIASIPEHAVADPPTDR